MASIPSSPPIPITSPATPRQLAELLGEAALRREPVAPIGGGSKLNFGNPLSREPCWVSTGGLNRVLAYEPDDMTISVEAGVTIGEVWRELAARGQTIPLDVPEPERESIGGLIATGLCGPRRFGSGTLRDALIGIQAAYPDGTLGNAGGMVVKNVSGFDLMRMHHGAVGTLGVVVSANFKVVPAARAEATILVERKNIDDVESDRLAIASGRIRPIAIEARKAGELWQVAVRIEGRPATVDQMAQELADRLGDARTLSTEASGAFWRHEVGEQALTLRQDAVVLRMRGKPSDIAHNANAALAEMNGTGMDPYDVRLSLGLGTVYLAADVESSANSTVARAIERLRQRGISVLVLSAPAGISSQIDAFGIPQDNLELMRQLKRQFDPGSVLNPGRVVPEL